jgi:hypothetical protein
MRRSLGPSARFALTSANYSHRDIVSEWVVEADRRRDAHAREALVEAHDRRVERTQDVGCIRRERGHVPRRILETRLEFGPPGHDV